MWSKRTATWPPHPLFAAARLLCNCPRCLQASAQPTHCIPIHAAVAPLQLATIPTCPSYPMRSKKATIAPLPTTLTISAPHHRPHIASAPIPLRYHHFTTYHTPIVLPPDLPSPANPLHPSTSLTQSPPPHPPLLPHSKTPNATSLTPHTHLHPLQPPPKAFIAANGVAIQGTPEWSGCVPEADTHRGNAAWSSRPGPCCRYRPAAPFCRLVRRYGPARPGEPFPHELQRPGPLDRPLHALIPCATAMWW